MVEMDTSGRQALDAVRRAMQVRPSDPRYPKAVADVVYLFGRAEWLPPAVERFLTPYLTGARGPDDAETLYTLGRIYQRAGERLQARMVFKLLVEVAGDHRDVQRRLADLLAPPEPSTPKMLESSRRRLTELTAERSRRERRDQLSRDLGDRSRELGLPVLSTGAVVADRYEVVAPLGEGGYAIVFEVWDRMLEERVAMKLFRPSPGGEAELKRFKQELRVTRKLVHPNVVATYDFKAWNGMHFITMELLEGADLLTILEEVGGRLPVDRSLILAGQAYAGLGSAHDKGVVHRDIKPANLFVLTGGTRLKVMDFGIAKTRESAGLTRPGWLVGTPAYLAPERLESGPAGHAPPVDVYAMGVVLYRMLAGRLPFHEVDFEKLGRMIRKDKPAPPSVWAPEVPRVVDQLVLDLLAKKPHDRPSGCGEVRARIRTILRAAPGAAYDRSLF